MSRDMGGLEEGREAGQEDFYRLTEWIARAIVGKSGIGVPSYRCGSGWKPDLRR